MAKLSIKLFGKVPPCPRCRLAERMISKAIPQLGMETDFTRYDILGDEAGKYLVRMSPAIVVNDTKLWEGGFPTTKEFVKAVRELTCDSGDS